MTKLILPAPARCVVALLVMVPLPPLPPLVGKEDDTRSTNTNSSPAALVHTVCQAMKPRALLDRPLPAGCPGGKGGKGDGSNDDGNAGSSGQSWIAHLIRMVPPFPPSNSAMKQQGWQASEGKGNKEGNGNGKEGGE